MNNITKLFKSYTPLQILKATVPAFSICLLYAAIIMIPGIVILLLYIPYTMYFMVGYFVTFSILSIKFNDIFVETLHHYQIDVNIDYDKFKTTMSIIMTICFFIIFAIIYFQIN